MVLSDNNVRVFASTDFEKSSMASTQALQRKVRKCDSIYIRVWLH